MSSSSKLLYTPFQSANPSKSPRYADGLLKTANITETRAAISSLLETYRAAAKDSSSPSNIIHIVQTVPSGTPIFTPDTPLASEFSELTPTSSEKVIAKSLPGAFKDTDLHSYLQSLPDNKGKKIVLAGYMAHVCVSTTARQGHELGYEVVVCGDAVGDRDIPGARGEEVTRMVLAELGDAFGTVVESRDVK
jgi:nicotinamidase-related amidase